MNSPYMPIQVPSLRPCQMSVVDGARYALARGVRDTSLGKMTSVIIQAEPGFGKTRISKWILGSSIAKSPLDNQSGYSVFCVHRRNLVDNADESFNEEPRLPHGLIMSGRETGWNNRLQVASIDTLLSWYVEGEKYTSDVTFDIIVFDECHSNLKTLIKFLGPHNKQREGMGLRPTVVIGLSATPSSQDIPKVFNKIIPGPSPQWLIDQGYLAPFRYMEGTVGDLTKLVKKAGEYTAASVSEAFKGLTGDLVRDWHKHAAGRPTVGFFRSLAEAREAYEWLNREGVRASYVDGSTPDDDRKRIFNNLGAGRIDYICNVGIVDRGTNIPEISCIQLAMSTASLNKFRQMIGRGSRTAPGKTDCLVIDHGGNIRGKNTHGFFEDEIEWVIEARESKCKPSAPKPTITCPGCGRIYRGGMCRSCDYQPTTEERKSQGLEFSGSELREITAAPKKKAEKTCEQLMISALYMAGKSGRTFKQAMGMAYGMAKKQGTQFRVPKTVTVGGRTYKMIPYGDPDQNRRVSSLYPFTVRKRNG